MEWTKESRYVKERLIAIKQLNQKFTNPDTLRRVERQLYNVTTKESRVSSWDNDEYIDNYFSVVNRFLKNIESKKINPKTFDNRTLTTKDITDVLGLENYKFILSDYLNVNIDFNRKNVIYTLYEKLMKIPRFKKIPLEKRLEIAIAIEKSCHSELERIIAKRCYDKFHHSMEIEETYNYITGRTITYVDVSSSNCSKDIIKDILKPEIYTKLGSMKSETVFKEKFTQIQDEIDMRMNITITEKISTEYTCKICKASRVTVKGIQTRSLDEGETLYAECVECRYKWRLT